ncbi:FadR family transcriptional regulator [Staphylococcus pseudoxylosus]|uniref:FadR/GntR family transcriptional regulator n=1 Tax=Staphylococcus pseudoxylosus TaxID=2282419 RepID=UPI000D1D4D9F|nr:FadR/GntR family transcriptional regulator [Staphylococcus pseudoxylosus]PTI44934.1 FadR family transcriptional regulator [Staphylococcus xylosus]MDW8798197.1 FadR/GntR family transcriptional regulator [Staphylococcus pseudoxylosus]MEB6037921.1 FadR family transcriptional regulator [Staphylococcus pseudoxylosus]MEB6046339.1 FadR family transcriptional regulator [Staphylococcus pseudoxylosus]MEB7765229.1 FadR family transcriptional regulator [Staphylococcus pseudoxylosus]
MRISNTKIYEQVADIILEQIKAGDYQVGDKLPSIQKLGKQYGVSVASVREALNALRTIGIIEMKQGYGTFIKQTEPTFFELGDKFTSLSQIKELLELREIVESATVEKAALYRTEENLVELKQALVEMGRAVTDGTSGEEADLEFHLSIAKAAQNTLLVELLNNISELMRNSMEETRKIFIYSKQKTMNKLLEEHEVIYQAILQQNDVKAVDAMRAHLLEVKETILANFKE